jgi:predicted metalloprotease with PDZ domain
MAASTQTGASEAFAWHYRARLEASGDLVVEGSFDGATDGEFSADDELAPFVRQFEVARGPDWRAVAQRAGSWRVPCGSGCAIRYRFALRDAARRLDQADTAIASGDVLISPPSTWLLHPASKASNAAFELTVDPGPNTRFVSAFEPVSGTRAHHYQAPIDVLDDASFAAFGPLHVADLSVGDSTVQLGVATHALRLTTEQVETWVATSAGAVASYYQGHLPARRTLVLLMQGGGASTRGITLGGGGPGVLVRASEQVTASTTGDDWVVTHELLHANFPDVGPAHSWLSEGLATYLEPIIRARVGLVDEAKVWRDMVDGMPQGLPQAGDQGLENTRTWGRTYWGGALFCLAADVELREKTGNRRSLDDVLLAIGKTGDSDQNYWPIERVLEMAERATGTQVFRELFERLAQKPGTIDLNQLFTQLGVRVQGKAVVFDEHAPLAALRKSITARRPG